MTKIEREAAQRQWEGLVANFRASGLSGPQWCEQRGWKLRQLRYWVAKFKRTHRVGSDPTWVALTDPVVASGAGLTIRIGAAEMIVEAGFDPALLQAVVRTLAAC